MMIFGGIFEITKELNDAHIYDIKNDRWTVIYKQKTTSLMTALTQSPTKSQYSFSQASPLQRKGTLKRGNMDNSPNLAGRASML